MKNISVQSINLCQSVIPTIYDIIKVHKGDLSLVSKEGQGSGFIIKLPAH